MQFNDGRTPSSFRFVLVNNHQLQIIGFDGTGTATGQANLQDISTFGISGLFGTYVFDFDGVDSSSKPLSQIGEFTADGMGPSMPTSPPRPARWTSTTTAWYPPCPCRVPVRIWLTPTFPTH